MMNADSPSIIRMVRSLGYGGLIPFLALAGLTLMDRERTMLWHRNLLSYGAVILSFVGSLHWGIATANAKIAARQRSLMFIWSVVPALMAFLALAAHSVVSDILLVSGFMLQYGMDLRIAPHATLPEWYLPLRLKLSVVAITCLATGALTIAFRR